MVRNRRAGVEDRWSKTVRDDRGNAQTVPSAANGKGLRWRARHVDDDGKEHAKGFRTKAEAQRWLNSVITAHETGSYIDPEHGKVTFASFYAEWSPRQMWVSGTRHAVNLAANSVTFARIPLADLRRSHIEMWIKAMQDNDLKATTIRTRFGNVHNVLRAAVRDRFMARDIAENVKLPRPRKPEAAMAIPTPAEVGAVIRVAEEFAAFIAVCGFAGLRRGEASALKVSDIDFLRKEIKVCRQVQWTDDGGMEIRAPKYGEERTVFIPERLVTMLSEHIRINQPGDDPDRWLFPGSRDSSVPTHAATVGRSWRILRKKVGIAHRLHDLRHFYASGLIAAGCDVVTVQRALGHSSAAITLSTYGHLWPDADDRTRKAASKMFEQSLGVPADALRTESPKIHADYGLNGFTAN